FARGPDRHRELATPLQHDQAPRLNRIQATSTRGVRARIRRVAGCATPTGSAGHAGATANLKLTFHLDHSAGAGHSRVQYDLTLRDAIAQRYFYVWRERRSFRTAKTRCGILNVRPGTTGLRYSASAPVTTIQDEDFAARPQLIREQLQAPPHKHSEKFRPVPPIASTIEHIGESRLGARDQSCIRPAIGTQTPWHDSCWLRLSLGTSEAFPVRICKRSAGVCFTDQDDAIGRQFLRG